MSAGFALHAGAPVAAPPAGARPRAPGAARPESAGLRLACFFALAAFGGYQYATLLLHPPVLRVLAVALAATAFGWALAAAARLAVPWPLRAVLALVLAAVALAVALLAIGVPARLLLPGRWHTLGRELHHGFDGLAGWLWPYRGGSGWARVTVLSLLAPVQIVAAAACFWPAGAARARATARGVALALLLVPLVTGLANQTAPAWRVQGVALLALVAAWLWMPGLGGTAVPRAGRWLLAAAVAALALAPALDGSTPLIDFRSWNPIQATASFQWDQLYGPISWSRSDATLLEVATPRPTLLRVTTLDRFDGLRFLRSSSPPGDRAADLPPAQHGPNGLVRATVAVAGLRSPLLVSGAGEPLRVHWLTRGIPAAAPEADGTTTVSPTPASGARYEVLSYAPSPGVAALRAAPTGYPARYLPYARFELPGPLASGRRTPDLAAEAAAPVPASALAGAPAPGRTPASDPRMARRIAASPYGPAFALARRLARGAPTRYDVAARIDSYLLAGYTYDEHPPQARYPLEAFLFGNRRGYCQQFSGAMTLLLRMDGIPARVAAGFRPAYDPATGRATVSALDAHSWVEVFFAGIGWVSFDPTPRRATGPSAPALVGAPARLAARARGEAASSPAAQRARALPAGGPARQGGGVAWWLIACSAALGALVLATAAWWLAGAVRLRRGLAGDGSGAVAELAVALARLRRDDGGEARDRAAASAAGAPPGAAPTLAALEQQLGSGGRAGAYLHDLRELRYAAPGAAHPSLRGRRELRRALAAGTGLRARVRVLLALPPGAARRV